MLVEYQPPDPGLPGSDLDQALLEPLVFAARRWNMERTPSFSPRWRVLLLSAAAVVALVAAGVLTQTRDVSAHPQDVQVTLAEFSVGAGANTIGITGPSEDETFTVTNTGEFPHEFIVIRTDLPADQLPMVADGSEVDESQLDIRAKTDLLQPGDTIAVIVSLTPGNYVLICNVSFGGNSHYANGMFTSFTVVQGVAGLPGTGSGGLADLDAGGGPSATALAGMAAVSVLVLGATTRLVARRRIR